jgi:aerobic-type carbon monoxide dehydrogenase small subunit (CoxS/CutS family)
LDFESQKPPSAKSLLDENPSSTEEEISEGISGNLCRFPD